MIKRSEAQWQELFQQHKASGLSAAEFCRQQLLCPKHFSLRKKQLGIKPAFVQVKPSSAAKSISSKVTTALSEDSPHQVRIRVIEFDVPSVGLSEAISSLLAQG